MSERWGSEAGRRPVYDQAVNEEATNSQLVGGCFPSDLTPTILPVVSTILCTRNRRGKLPLTLTIYKVILTGQEKKSLHHGSGCFQPKRAQIKIRLAAGRRMREGREGRIWFVFYIPSHCYFLKKKFLPTLR
ncbi:hypothetical protein SEVIR_3G184301v4 [Setaria viridis]|uniref:Uncharacterized protein n=1 Tax=Setaria viridis TaxID=4556 RepID=A0A4U6VGC0_SETVI|nr:hypothetical protein SEVIR_3G184301v2 [Setaria viridis]